MTNLNSLTELTEFAPLSPETKQSGVTSIFSKIFKFSKDEVEQKNREKNVNIFSGLKYPSINENESYDSDWTSIISGNQDVLSVPSQLPIEHYRFGGEVLEVRNLPNVLRRVSNLLALRNKNSLLYNDTSLKQYWMPDSVSKECYDCGEKFTTFRRRHHCRICGQIFCSQCCSQEVPGKIIGCGGHLRVCTYCCKVVLSYLQESDLSVDLKALQEDLLLKFADNIEDKNLQDNVSVTGINISSDINKRKISVVYQEEKFAASHSPLNTIWYDNENNRKNELASLNTLLQELMNGENPLPLQSIIVQDIKYDLCFTGGQLIDWLITQRKTSSRTHSIAIGQVLLDANYIESVAKMSDVFIDGLIWYKFCELLPNVQDYNENVPINEKSKTQTGNSAAPGGIQSVFYLDLNIHKNTVHISRQPPKNICSKDKKKSSMSVSDCSDTVLDDFISTYLKLGQLNPTNWAHVEVDQLQEKHKEKSGFHSISDCFQQHLQNATNQLLSLENLSLSWFQIIVPLAEQALNEIKLDFDKTDIIHIGNYIRIKNLPGGERNDNCLIKGIVCSKDVAHREMCARLANPRILLLQCAVVYQRVEGRLMSLEPVMMQEQEYLRNAVARIISLKPDIILVHRNVSRLAQESLNAVGITLVLNVKLSIMERVARCTNADILTSVDSHVGSTKLGTCRSFYTKKFTLKDGGTKTLMFFEGCAFPQLGCTILLRGASEVELKKLKQVTNSVVFMKYNAKLEKSFLLDEFAEPPAVPSFTFIGELTSPKRTVKSCNKHFCEKNNESLMNDCTTHEKSKHDSESVSRIEDKRVSMKLIVESDDPLHVNQNAEDELTSPDAVETISNNLTFTEVSIKQNKFKASLQDTVLSFSPFIEFNLPYLETECGLFCEMRKYFPSEIYYSMNRTKKEMSWSGVTDTSMLHKSTDFSNIPKKPPHPFVTTKLKDNAMNDDLQALLAMYRACGGRFTCDTENTSSTTMHKVSTYHETKQIEMDVFDPRNHQRLSVLFCCFSHYSNNSPEFCVNPWIVNMNFYGCNDIPLGSFLEKYCFRKTYMCPSNTCETPMIEHERRFVHDTGCMHITLTEIESLPNKNNRPILLWSACTACKAATPLVAMSNDTWNLSFAKYLELRFHAGKYGCRADSAERCSHSLHYDYCQYFYRNNIVASFKYTDILLWEIALPPTILKIQVLRVNIPNIMDQIKKWAVTGHEVFSSILEKLCSYDNESNLITIQGLKKHLGKQQILFKQKIDDIQVILTSSTLTDVNNTDETVQKDLFKLEDSIVLMKKFIAEALLNWNMMLQKLDSRKRDDKSKNKSYSSDLIDNSNTTTSRSTLTSSDELNLSNDDTNTFLEAFDEQSVSTETVNYESTCLKANKNERIESCSSEKEQYISNVDNLDGSLSQLTSSNETVNLPSQIPTSDRMTVKALLSQLLPNTFQNTGSILFNPINADEHYLMDITSTIPLVVYESEPSSIISYALNSYQYLCSLEELLAKAATNTNEFTIKNTLTKKESSDSSSFSTLIDSPSITENENPIKFEGAEDNKMRSGKSVDAEHIEVHFSDSTANFTVKVYFAQQFKEVRDLVFLAGEEVYIRSLSRCVQWAAHGGKSGSSFCKTKDDRFILKEMSRLEIQPFLEFATNYFNYIRMCHVSQMPTLLVKIVGVYRVKWRNSVSNQTFQSNLLVMENLFYTKDIIRKFDLKGSVRNRLVNTKSNHEGELVLLDENLINMTWTCPLYIYPHSKTVLMKAINNDVIFLASQSVMDYSLLVGLDETSQELLVGIIDYIRTFTWDKKLETMVKKTGLLGGQGKLPTIISPEEYKNRFIAAMHKYFLAVPDQWLGFGKSIDY